MSVFVCTQCEAVHLNRLQPSRNFPVLSPVYITRRTQNANGDTRWCIDSRNAHVVAPALHATNWSRISTRIFCKCVASAATSCLRWPTTEEKTSKRVWGYCLVTKINQTESILRLVSLPVTNISASVLLDLWRNTPINYVSTPRRKVISKESIATNMIFYTRMYHFCVQCRHSPREIISELRVRFAYRARLRLASCGLQATQTGFCESYAMAVAILTRPFV